MKRDGHKPSPRLQASSTHQCRHRTTSPIRENSARERKIIGSGDDGPKI
jgi:hypothetical protein